MCHQRILERESSIILMVKYYKNITFQKKVAICLIIVYNSYRLRYLITEEYKREKRRLCTNVKYNSNEQQTNFIL